MTRTNTDHVICDARDSGAFRCMHCGDRHQPALPVPLAIFCESAKGYALMHKRCLPKPEPTKQVELFDALAKKEIRESFAREIEAQEIAADGGNGSVCSMHDYEPPGAISALTDEPAPEIDPPGPPTAMDRFYAKNSLMDGPGIDAAADETELAEHDKPELTDQDDPFGRRYPMARTVARLRDDLAVVLQGVLVPTSVQLDLVVPGSTLWDRLAHWTRVELCRANLTEHPELEVYLPAHNAMPRELVAMRKALKEAEPKPKRGARPLSNPRKRRSGSTQHTP